MLGAVVGLFLAVWYRAEGPQRPVPFYENEEEETGGVEENGNSGENQKD